MNEVLRTSTEQEIRKKNELQIGVMKYAEATYGIEPLDWADPEGRNYSKHFRLLWEEGDIAQRYQLALDEHPETLAALCSEIQTEIMNLDLAEQQ